MLNDVSDYTYNAANISSDGVVIEGRIIPTEDINGEAHLLRRENYAFLSEAISERLDIQHWEVPARNEGLKLSLPKSTWMWIKSIYDGNYPQQPGMGTYGYVKPDYVFGDSVSNTDYPWPYRAYMDSLLSADDLPEYMYWDFAPLYLWAEDMRTMFYYMNLLRRRWLDWAYDSSGQLHLEIGKNGGTIRYDAVLFDNNAPSPSTPIPVHDSAAIVGFSSADVQIRGSVTGGSGDPISYSITMYATYLYRFYAAEYYAGTLYLDGGECYYEGDCELTVATPQTCGSNKQPLLFVQFVVSGSEGNIGKTQYVWRPIPNATFVRNEDNKVTSVKFPVNKAWTQSLVRLVFPSANFDYATPRSTNASYRAYILRWDIMEYPDFHSLLPEEWTWTPPNQQPL